MTTAPPQPGPTTPGGGPESSLTPTELAVLVRAAHGSTYAVIARDLGYTEKSVSKMAARLSRKLGAHNIAHAVYLAVAAGLLEPTRRHGDHPGFVAHRRRDEEPCEACWEGERAYRRELRAARKAREDTAS